MVAKTSSAPPGESVPTCFVIMPISTPPGVVADYGGDAEHFRHVFTELLTPAIERSGYEVIPPAVATSAVILTEIFKNLASADLAVCDMSTLNANVFFELGVRVTLNRPVVMIKDDRTSTIPFDNAGVACHTYRSSQESYVVRDEIPRLTKWIESAAGQQDNAVWRVFGNSEWTATGRDHRSTSEPVHVDFLMAVTSLLERTGLNKRAGTFEARLDQHHRGVTLVFSKPPSSFLTRRLREEARDLDLTLRL